MKTLKLSLFGILFLLFSNILSSAQETASTPETPNIQAGPAKADDRVYIVKDEWRFFVAPYMWLVGVNVNLSKQGTRGATAAADVPWYDIVPDYFSKVFGAMGRIEVWKGPWGFFVDNVYLYVGDSLSKGGSKKIDLNNAPVTVQLIASGNLKLIIRQGFLDVGGRYLLGTLPLSSERPLPLLSCELLGGVRYNWINQSTSLAVNTTLNLNTSVAPVSVQRTKSKNFDLSFNYMVVEPFLGLRTGFWFTEKLNLLLRADIGGFRMVAFQDFNSNLEALVGYKVQDYIRLYLGYRGRYYAFNKGSDAIKSFGWYNGPVVGAVFSF